MSTACNLGIDFCGEVGVEGFGLRGVGFQGKGIAALGLQKNWCLC